MSIKDQLLAARQRQKAAAEAAKKKAAEPKPAPVAAKPKTNAGARARIEAAEAEAAELRRQFAEMKRTQQEMADRQAQSQRDAIHQERVKYAMRAGAKISPELLGRLLPDADPNTSEGRKALEDFRTAHPDIFRPPERSAADITKGLETKIEAHAKQHGQRQPLSERKLFGAELVKATVEKNLGGAR
jgi:hypothetical protein